MTQISEIEFRAHYERHSGPLFRFIYRFTANQEAAEEILQDVFMKLLNGGYQATPDGSVKAWLYAVAKNQSLNVVKKNSFEVKSAAIVEKAVADFDLEEQLVETSRLDQFKATEKTLPADLKQTWELRKKGYDYQQISAELDIPLGTVKSRFSRLVDFFRKEMTYEP